MESQLQETTRQLDVSKADLVSLSELHDGLMKQLAESESNLSEKTAAVESLTAEVQTVRNDKKEVESKMFSLLMQLDVTRDKLKVAETESEQSKTAQTALDKKVTQLQALYQQALSNLKTANEALTTSKDRYVRFFLCLQLV